MSSKFLEQGISRIAKRAFRPTSIYFELVMIFVSLLAVNTSYAYAQQTRSDQSRAPQIYTREGVTVEFTVEPVAQGPASEVMEGTEATVRFKITDSNAGKPLTNLRPAAWIDSRKTGKAPDARECREKIQAFLQANYTARAEIDLNSYFVLALNQEPNISVIDPISGFGSTKLYTLVPLRSPGEDWVLSRDQKRLYVSMPLVNQVAVIDTISWEVIANINTGLNPTRILLQHDEKYLWVGNDIVEGNTGSVTVIDTASLKVAAQINTGAGHHEIALNDDDSYAFVTNKQSGTLSVVDVRKLVKIKDLKTGALPASLAFSSLSKAVYVAHEGEGTITAVGGPGHEILAQMKAQPGLYAIRFLPDGRFGFVVNRATNTVFIFDASTNRILHAVPVGPTPDQITFTRDFAYIRTIDSEFVSMIKIIGIGRDDYEVAVSRFPAGQKAPKESSFTALANSITPAPEDGAVLVANPADKMIYFYSEGMAAPMGTFQNYKRDPRALLVVDNSLNETSPGVYTTTVRLNRLGQYDVAFLLDSPRMVNCFDLSVKENPNLPKQKGVSIKVEALSRVGQIRVGESYQLRFKVTDPLTRQPIANLKDMGVLVFLAPGIWQERQWARAIGDGVYEMSFVPPQAGVYYVFFQTPSLGVMFNQIPSLIFQATTDKATTGSTESRP